MAASASRPGNIGALWQAQQDLGPVSFDELNQRIAEARMPRTGMAAIPRLPQQLVPGHGPDTASTNADFSMVDRTGFYRDDEYRFGHQGERSYFDLVQKGVTMRHIDASASENPAFVREVEALERQAGSLVASGSDNRYSGYSGS